ncbi:MAG: 4'-phosphopantetheinyl transferase superfamily protein [Rhodobacteraceae bacterium]|nr:4'-phosphopantetheinyl transferase superfamily protein [Paracoccaceae bacterium]
MAAADRIVPLEATLAALFPPGTAVAAEPIRAPDRGLPAAEAAAVAGASPARRAEFVAGRAAARRALAALGLPPVAIPAGTDRAPLWPAGVGGSIAHGAGVAVAAARLGPPLGLDVEENAPLEADLWPEICGPDELAALPPGDTGLRVRRVFAAKEAVYKAQYPLTGRLFGFELLEVTLRPGGFAARLREGVGPFARGHVFPGRLAEAGRLLLAGVAL